MTLDIATLLPAGIFGELTAQQNVASGMSGASVRAVTTSRGEFIVRIYHGDQATWQRTLAIHRQAAQSSIAPPLLHVDEARQATVSQKITGTSFGAALAEPGSRQAAVASLVSVLAKLHALPTSGLAPTAPMDFTRTLFAAQAQRAGFPAWAAPLGLRLVAIAQILAGDDTLVLSHGDLNPANILWDGTRVWLVDWDAAGLCHPYLDLATIANFLSLPDATATSLLAMQQRAAIDDDQQEIFRACRDLSRIAYASIFLHMIADLGGISFASRAQTPTLADCFGRLMKGELDMGSAAGQAQIAAAFFRQCEQDGSPLQ